MKILKYFVLFLFILILIFLGKGLMTPSISYSSEFTVDKSAKEAWAVMSDESKLPQWIDGFKRTELVSGTPNKPGAVSNIYVEQGGEEMVMEETLNAVQEEELLDMTFRMDFMDMDYKMTLEEKNGKTHIRSNSVTKGNGIIARSIVSFMPKTMKDQEDKNMARLQKLIDENTTNYFPEPILVPSEEPVNQ